MEDLAVELTEPSETDMDTDRPAHSHPQYIGWGAAPTRKNSDTNINNTKINSPNIWIEDSVRGNTTQKWRSLSTQSLH